MEVAWTALQSYATSQEQLLWLQEELRQHPILNGQSPDDWLHWRTKVADGMSELAALQAVAQNHLVAQQPGFNTAGPSQQAFHHLPHSTSHPPPPTMSVPTFPTQIGEPSPYGYASMSHMVPNGVQNPHALAQPQHDPFAAHSPVVSSQGVPQPFVAPQQHAPSSSQDFEMTGYSAPHEVTSEVKPDTKSWGSLPNPQAASIAAPEGRNGSPFDDLGSGASPTRSRQATNSPAPTTLRVVPKTKQTTLPFKPSTDTAKTDSSAISRSPKETTPNPNTLKRPADSTGATRTMAEIRPYLERAKLQEKPPRPGVLFKFFRWKDLADGSRQPPMFTPNPKEYAEIFMSLQARAPDAYLRKMADDERYTEVLVACIKLFLRDPTMWEVAIAPLMRMLARTDMPVDYIRELKVAKHLKNLNDKVQTLKLPHAAEVKAAFREYTMYCKDVLFPRKRESRNDSDSDSDSRAVKKRKMDAARAKPAPPPSHPAAARPGTAAKTDMSFFGASSSAAAKPKPKLPDFTKRPNPALNAAAAGSAAAPGRSLLAATMKMLRKDESPVPVVKRDPTPDFKAEIKPEPKAAAAKLNKKGHTVRWIDSVPKPDREFVAVREFVQEPFELERAPWDIDVDVHGMSTRQLDMQEGRAMHIHEGVEEAIDWYEPCGYEIPPLEDPPEVPEGPREADIQAEREAQVLSVNYPSDAIPPSADEAGVRTAQRDDKTVMLNTQPTYPGAPAHYDPAAPVAPPQPSVSELLRNLNLPLLGAAAPAPEPAPAHGYGYQSGGYAQSYDQGNSGYQYPSAPSHHAAPQSGWGNANSDSGYGGANTRGGFGARGGGWQNRGRGAHAGQSSHSVAAHRPGAPFRKVPCRFFKEGTCRAGPDCTFLH